MKDEAIKNKKFMENKVKDNHENDKDIKNENSNENNAKKPEIATKTNEDKIKELEEKIIRTLAEMENQRRRFEKEKEDAFEFGGFAFAKECITIIDNLERAKISISHNEQFKDNKDLSKFLENFDIIQKDLISVFKKNGIEQINCLEKKFDPNYHQAMMEIEDENKDIGTIVQEIQKGFTMKNRLLRPSLVGVTKKKTQISNEKEEKDKENKQNQENNN